VPPVVQTLLRLIEPAESIPLDSTIEHISEQLAFDRELARRVRGEVRDLRCKHAAMHQNAAPCPRCEALHEIAERLRSTRPPPSTGSMRHERIVSGTHHIGVGEHDRLRRASGG
jgi:hypothetical protein